MFFFQLGKIIFRKSNQNETRLTDFQIFKKKRWLTYVSMFSCRQYQNRKSILGHPIIFSYQRNWKCKNYLKSITILHKITSKRRHIYTFEKKNIFERQSIKNSKIARANLRIFSRTVLSGRYESSTSCSLWSVRPARLISGAWWKHVAAGVWKHDQSASRRPFTLVQSPRGRVLSLGMPSNALVTFVPLCGMKETETSLFPAIVQDSCF